MNTLKKLACLLPLVLVTACATQKGDIRLSSIHGVPHVLSASAVQAYKESADSEDAGRSSSSFISPLFLGSHWTTWDVSDGDDMNIRVEMGDDDKESAGESDDGDGDDDDADEKKSAGKGDDDDDDEDDDGDADWKPAKKGERTLHVQNVDFEWLHSRVTHGTYNPDGSLNHQVSLMSIPFFFCYMGIKAEDLETKERDRVDLGLLGLLWLSTSEHKDHKNETLQAVACGSVWYHHQDNGEGSAGPLWGFIGWRSRGEESGAPVFFWTALW